MTRHNGIPDEEYVTVGSDGHLQLKGRRARFWGVILAFSPEAEQWKKLPETTVEERTLKAEKVRKDIAFTAQRIADLGFNMYRCWQKVSDREWTKGDLSMEDMWGYLVHQLDERGVKVWFSAMNWVDAVPEDVGIVDDQSTAGKWKEAVAETIRKTNKLEVNGSLATAWDDRLEAIRIRHARNVTNYRNHYKGGIRLADDPQVAVWEISNEERWLPRMLRGEWQKLHPFFIDGLLRKWHGFLEKKYANDQGLVRAWTGLLPGESLEKRTVLLAPLQGESKPVTMNDVNPQAVAALRDAVKQQYSRDDFNRHRGEDVIEFFLETLIAHKTRVMNAGKKMGKSARLSPWLLDTGEGYNTQYTYLHQHGDAVSICTYMYGAMNDKTDSRFPWNSLVDEMPRLCWNVPWIETQRIPGKPFLAYETNADNPSKYRAEYPYLFASLASIQDFDAACWHTFTNGIFDADDPEAFNKAMDYSASENPNPDGLHYRYDEIFCSAIRAAGVLFTTFALDPAPKPTEFIFGRRTLNDPASMDYGVAYGEFGRNILPTTYRFGTRMRVDPTREDDEVRGPVLLRNVYEACPVSPTSQIQYHWRESYYKADSPSGAVYVGFLADYNYGGPVHFSNGVVLDKVTINNPEGIAYPVKNYELFVAFSLITRDGLALDRTRSAQVSLVSTSFNSEFKLDHDKFCGEFHWGNSPGVTVDLGRAPVLVARPGATIMVPEFEGMHYVMKDWNMNVLGKGTLRKGRIVLPNTVPVFVVELSR